MGTVKTWYRVVDPLNPLYGCDVRVLGTETSGYFKIYAMRRVDILVGDRPFQLISKDGDDLGLMISESCLSESPLQDDIIETGTDRPHGRCLDESEMTRKDGTTLRIARYERATQIAVEDNNGDLMGTATEVGDCRGDWERAIVDMFEAGAEVDDIAYSLEDN